MYNHPVFLAKTTFMSHPTHAKINVRAPPVVVVLVVLLLLPLPRSIIRARHPPLPAPQHLDQSTAQHSTTNPSLHPTTTLAE